MTPDLLSRRPRSKRVFSADDMARMRDLYCDRDVPLPQVAAAFGVPGSTLHRWIAEMDWPRRSAGWSPASAPHPNPLPAGGERETPSAKDKGKHKGKPLNPDRLALEVAAAARLHLSALGDVTQPMSLDERRQRADIIASLSRSIARIDKTFETRTEREALKRTVKTLQDKLYAYENADLIELQKQTLATIRDEFERVRGQR